MSEPPSRPPQEDVRYRAREQAERREGFLNIVVKVVIFLVLGTIGLGVLFFGTCVLLMRH